MTRPLARRISEGFSQARREYTLKQWITLGFQFVLVIDAIIIITAFLGTIAGAALMGSMFAALGLVPPFIFLLLFDVNATTAGLVNLVVTVATVAYSYGQRRG